MRKYIILFLIGVLLNGCLNDESKNPIENPIGYSLVIISTNGTVSKSPNQNSYPFGANVQLIATPNNGYLFSGWSGDASGSTNPLSVTMNSNKNITANYSVDTTNACLGTLTVTYEGKTYNTVQIGNQCWLKENLDVGTMIQVIQESTHNGVIEKYCFDNDVNNCETYGGLYQWAEAVQYKNGATNINSTNPAFGGNVQGICPSGWHIPTLGEFETLKAAVSNNSNALKAIGQGTGSGAGTNTSGFCALLAGGRWHDRNNYGLGEITIFWSFTEKTPTAAYHMSLDYGTSDVHLTDIYITKKNGFSIRCLKD
jgi:uncharacterized protein (TIGR02145 family)/uncharacterized repeat protein (TIGR02543 family)